MSTEALLYWITRLDAIHAIILTGIIVAIIVVVISGVFSLSCECNQCDECREIARYVFMRTLPFAFLFIMMRIFIPTAQETLIIVGVGGTIEYLKSNETAVQLPDKAIKALDKLVDDYLEDEKSRKHDE